MVATDRLRRVVLSGFVPLLCCTACSDTSDPEAAIDGGGSPAFEAAAEPGPAPDELDGPPVLGTASVVGDGQEFALAVTRCDVRSVPGASEGLVSLDLQATEREGTAGYRLSLQLQQTTAARVAMLLGFENEATDLVYTGAAGTVDDPFDVRVNDAAFDIATGTNGVLEPVGSGFAPPVPVALEVAAHFLAQTLINNDTQIKQTDFVLALAADCQLSWLLPPE